MPLAPKDISRGENERIPVHTDELIRALPKAEQHVHIVGSIRPETLLWLAEQAGVEAPFHTVEEAHRFFQYRDFPHFIQAYTTILNLITREDQFERITYELLEDEDHCNTRYVEASFSAPDHVLKGLDYDKMLDAINRGAHRAQQDYGIVCNLRIDLVRNYGPALGMDVLSWIEGKRDNVVSIDIGGSEDRYPPKPYAQVYRKAKEMGLHLTAHAGEAAGPKSAWDAVEYLGVERIGHGVTAVRDSALIKHLKERNITIEACPTSNVRTGVTPSLSHHPIRNLFDYGVNVTANSDDPTMFDTDMNNEYLQLHKVLGFTVPELFRLSLNAVNSSFLPQKQKDRTQDAFAKEYQRIVNRAESSKQCER